MHGLLGLVVASVWEKAKGDQRAEIGWIGPVGLNLAEGGGGQNPFWQFWMTPCGIESWMTKKPLYEIVSPS